MCKWNGKGNRLLAGLTGAIVTLCFVLSNPTSCKAQIELTAPSAILIERSTGTVVYEKNADEKRSPASITKIMTLLLTFEQIHAGKADLQEDVLVSERAASMGGSQVYLAQGEIQTLDTMIKCIAVASGNDASVAVAEHIAGSEEAFVKMMNDKAADLGMTGTHFQDCCGLSDSENHYTTARDVAIMSRELITEYPEVKGKVTCSWWLRTSGTFVSISGSTISNVVWEPGDELKPYRSPCEMEDKGVRPAIWITVDTASD